MMYETKGTAEAGGEPMSANGGCRESLVGHALRSAEIVETTSCGLPSLFPDQLVCPARR